MNQDQQARLRLRRTLSNFLTHQPFFAMLVLRMPFQADLTRLTIASDGTHIRYNPDWVMSVQIEDVRAALARIVLACALKHHLRREDRNYPKWQMASYLVTTPLLRSAGMINEQGGLDMSVEQAYKELPDLPELEQPGEGEGGGNQQQGQGQGQDQDQQQGHDQQQADQPPSFDPDGKGEIMDAPRPASMSTSDYKELCKSQEQEWDEVQAQAQQMAKNQGNMPGNISQVINAQHVHTIDWRLLLRRFISAAAKDDYSWSKPNHRFIAQGLYLPSLHSESMPPIVFAIDTSASVNDEALSALWTEIRGAAKVLRPEKVTVIQCDYDIQDVTHYHTDELPMQIKVQGRGGTAFKPVFEKIAKEGMYPSVLVYLTDLGVGQSDFPSPPPYETIWTVIDSWGDTAPPFGQRIDVRV